MSFLSFIISLFEAKKCYFCHQDGHFFCPQCCSDLERYSSFCYACKKESKNFEIHHQCQRDFPYIQSIIVLTRYRQQAIKKGLKHGKYYKKFGFYQDIIGGNTDFFEKYICHKKSILVPVPMHILRKWKRGYNQSEIIAKNVSKICEIPVENKLLKKTRHTSQQSRLGVSQRQKNLLGTFSVNKKSHIDKKTHIYLVDDVVSSGSTLLECAKILHQNGYKNISAVCLASD